MATGNVPDSRTPAPSLVFTGMGHSGSRRGGGSIDSQEQPAGLADGESSISRSWSSRAGSISPWRERFVPQRG